MVGYLYGIVNETCWSLWYQQVPINQCPFAKVQTYTRDGHMVTTENGGGKPNYYPNSFEELPQPDPSQPDVHPYKYVTHISDLVVP